VVRAEDAGALGGQEGDVVAGPDVAAERAAQVGEFGADREGVRMRGAEVLLGRGRQRLPVDDAGGREVLGDEVAAGVERQGMASGPPQDCFAVAVEVEEVAAEPERHDRVDAGRRPGGEQRVGGGEDGLRLLVRAQLLTDGALREGVDAHDALRGAGGALRPAVVEVCEADAAQDVQRVEGVLGIDRPFRPDPPRREVPQRGIAGQDTDRDPVRIQHRGRLHQRPGQAGRRQLGRVLHRQRADGRERPLLVVGQGAGVRGQVRQRAAAVGPAGQVGGAVQAGVDLVRHRLGQGDRQVAEGVRELRSCDGSSRRPWTASLAVR
jgi:hypothetical protein